MTTHSTTVGVAELIRHGLEPIVALSPLKELPVIVITSPALTLVAETDVIDSAIV